MGAQSELYEPTTGGEARWISIKFVERAYITLMAQKNGFAIMAGVMPMVNIQCIPIRAMNGSGLMSNVKSSLHITESSVRTGVLTIRLNNVQYPDVYRENLYD